MHYRRTVTWRWWRRRLRRLLQLWVHCSTLLQLSVRCHCATSPPIALLDKITATFSDGAPRSFSSDTTPTTRRRRYSLSGASFRTNTQKHTQSRERVRFKFKVRLRPVQQKTLGRRVVEAMLQFQGNCGTGAASRVTALLIFLVTKRRFAKWRSTLGLNWNPVSHSLPHTRTFVIHRKQPLCDYFGPLYGCSMDPATKRVLSFHGEKKN